MFCSFQTATRDGMLSDAKLEKRPKNCPKPWMMWDISSSYLPLRTYCSRTTFGGHGVPWVRKLCIQIRKWYFCIIPVRLWAKFIHHMVFDFFFFPNSGVPHLQAKRAVHDQVMLVCRLTEESSILKDEMTRHVQSIKDMHKTVSDSLSGKFGWHGVSGHASNFLMEVSELTFCFYVYFSF